MTWDDCALQCVPHPRRNSADLAQGDHSARSQDSSPHNLHPTSLVECGWQRLELHNEKAWWLGYLVLIYRLRLPYQWSWNHWESRFQTYVMCIDSSESLSCPGSYGMPLRPIISTYSHVLQTASGSGIHRNHQSIYIIIHLSLDARTATSIRTVDQKKCPQRASASQAYLYTGNIWRKKPVQSAGSMWTLRPAALDGCPTPGTRCQLIPHQHQAPPLPRQLQPVEAMQKWHSSGVLVFATRQDWSTTKNQMYAAKLLILWLVCVSLSVWGCPSIALRCLAKALRISIWENLYAVRSLHMNLEQANDWGWPNLALFQVPLAPEPAGFSKRLPGRFLFIYSFVMLCEGTESRKRQGMTKKSIVFGAGSRDQGSKLQPGIQPMECWNTWLILVGWGSSTVVFVNPNDSPMTWPLPQLLLMTCVFAECVDWCLGPMLGY